MKKLVTVVLALNAGTALADARQITLEQVHKKYGVPGLGAGKFVGGKEWYGVVGVRKIDSPVPISLADKFHLGSNTKSMTAVLLAQLIEEGKLSWNSKLVDLLPELSKTLHEDYRGVTLAQLTSHRSGVTGAMHKFEFGKLWKKLWDKNLDPVEGRKLTAQMMLTVKPSYKPGSKFEYSNANYIIAGAIIENLTLKSWETVITEKLFKPLKMTSCGFGAAGSTDPLFPDQPWGHKFQGQFVAIPPGIEADNPPSLGPAGRVHCSLQDWMKYLRTHVDGHSGKNTPVLKAASFKKLHASAMNQTYTYGGWIRNDKEDGQFALAHEGDNTLSHSVVVVIPKKKVIAIGTTNIGGDVGGDSSFELVEKLLSEK